MEAPEALRLLDEIYVGVRGIQVHVRRMASYKWPEVRRECLETLVRPSDVCNVIRHLSWSPQVNGIRTDFQVSLKEGLLH